MKQTLCEDCGTPIERELVRKNACCAACRYERHKKVMRQYGRKHYKHYPKQLKKTLDKLNFSQSVKDALLLGGQACTAELKRRGILCNAPRNTKGDLSTVFFWIYVVTLGLLVLFILNRVGGAI